MKKQALVFVNTRQSAEKTAEEISRKIKTTSPEKVHEEMDDLINWYDSKPNKFHPIKLASLFHGKFEQIHPFEDGNGRVGRFLINIILLKKWMD